MKKILIMTARAGFPNGFGASSILRKYARGFSENGYDVHIMLLRPSEVNSEQANFEKKGIYEGSSFEYMCKTVFTSRSKIKRLFLYSLAIFRSVCYIVANRNIVSKLFFYSPDFLFSVNVILLLCRVLGIECIGIKTESSFCDSQRIKMKGWMKKEKFIYAGFNKIVVVSKYLKNQLLEFGYKNEIQVVPILVDENMYEGCFGDRKKEIVYMGSMGHEEELHAIAQIIAYVKENYNDWKVVLIGDVGTRKELLSYIKTGDVECTGRLSYEELARRIFCSGILILPRSMKEYSIAGFPIKIGEYLLTGAPVLVTNVGEIEEYLTNEKEIFIVESDNTDAFNCKLKYIIENYKEALKVGEEGKKAALRIFGAKDVCRKMLS